MVEGRVGGGGAMRWIDKMGGWRDGRVVVHAHILPPPSRPVHRKKHVALTRPYWVAPPSHLSPPPYPKPTHPPTLSGGAWLELVHVLLGLAGGSVSSAFWQNFGRWFVLFCIVDAFETGKHSAWLPSLLLAWSAGEMIRYVLCR